MSRLFFNIHIKRDGHWKQSLSKSCIDVIDKILESMSNYQPISSAAGLR